MDRVTDYYGRAIEPGAKVAFNYSGQVRFGEVIELGKVAEKIERGEIQPDRWGRYPYLRIRVRHRDFTSQVSLVRDRHNLVVLDGGG